MAPIFTGFRFGFGGGAAGPAGPFSATGGDVANALEPGNGYKYHTFTSPGTFVVPQSGTVEILLVAGGGAGGYRIAGGGGAGGVLYGTTTLIIGTYNVTVGKGGYGGAQANNSGGSPTDFYLSGASFPSPSNFARAYGGGSSGGYVTENGTPLNGGVSTGGGGAGGSSGGAGNQYGTMGYPGFSSKVSGAGSAGPSEYVINGYPYSPITPAPYGPPLYSTSATAYGSDAPVPTPGYVHPSYFDQSMFPTTYYIGLQGYGNDGGMTFGPTLAGGGGGGGGAGSVGQDRGSPPATSAPTSVTGADGGDGLTFSGFTAPLFCDPATPTGGTVKSVLDPLGGYFAAGGGGANYDSSQGATYGGGRGGKGGGGNGAPDGSPGTTFAPGTYNRYPQSSTTRNGVFYSGSGGGGGGYSYESAGGHGAPGIVIIRYLA